MHRHSTMSIPFTAVVIAAVLFAVGSASGRLRFLPTQSHKGTAAHQTQHLCVSEPRVPPRAGYSCAENSTEF
jgi:hypothetical protein